MTAYGKPPEQTTPQPWKEAKEERRKQLAAVRARRRIIYQRFLSKQAK